MSARVVATNVSVVRGGRRILDSASLTIASGELTAIVGPNGSGKSTLLRALSGLWKPETGSVVLDGAPIEAMTRRQVARRLAFLPQDTRCDFAFTVEEFVAMGRHPHRGRFESETRQDRSAIEHALVTCDLQELCGRTVDRLSGGERQRAAIARCLATEPDAILLDEPTAHLDLEHALAIFSLCATLATAGRAIALATHDLATVSRYATNALVLHRGRVAALGPPASVLTPELCRTVFAVDVERMLTSAGVPALIFTPAQEAGNSQGTR